MDLSSSIGTAISLPPPVSLGCERKGWVSAESMGKKRRWDWEIIQIPHPGITQFPTLLWSWASSLGLSFDRQQVALPVNLHKTLNRIGTPSR